MLSTTTNEIDKVIKYEQPTTQMDLRSSFLWLTSYFRQSTHSVLHYISTSVCYWIWSRFIKTKTSSIMGMMVRHIMHSKSLKQQSMHVPIYSSYKTTSLSTYTQTLVITEWELICIKYIQGDTELPIALQSKTISAEQKHWSVPDKEWFVINYICF